MSNMQGKTPSATKLIEKECLTPRGHGGGDGIRPNISARKRLPISSARKFNARAPRDESLKLKLETAMEEMRSKTPTRPPNKSLKSASVAEITPTKSKRRRSRMSMNDSSELYATPRPLFDQPKVKLCIHERNACQIYKKLMLLAWRRSRNQAKTNTEQLEKQTLQITQLEMQRDVLSHLRVSESNKREEIQGECQKLKKSLEVLEMENNNLNEELQNLQHSFELVKNEKKVVQAENNFLSEQTIKAQEIIAKKKAEAKLLEEKIKAQDEEISKQKTATSSLEEKLNELQKKFKALEVNYRIKEKKYAQLKCQFKKQLDHNNSMSKQLRSLEEEKLDISLKVDDLETQLNDYIRSCENLEEINNELTQEVHDISIELKEERKHNWLRNTKHFALLSLSALQKIADAVVPVYLNAPANF